MNVTKRILVIDDEDQKNDMESIARKLKKHVQIKYEQINVLDSDFLDEKLNLRQDVFEKRLMEVLTESYYDLILVDYLQIIMKILRKLQYSFMMLMKVELE